MAEEQTPGNIPPVEPTHMPPIEPEMASQPRPEGSVAEELGELGKRLAAAVKAAWETPERKQLERELVAGMQSISKELEKGVDQLRTSVHTGEIKQQVEKAADQAKARDVLEDVRGGLLQGLREVNSQLDKMIESLEQRKAGETGSGAHAVPIDMGPEPPSGPEAAPGTPPTPPGEPPSGGTGIF